MLAAAQCPKYKLRIYNSPGNLLFMARYMACVQADTPHVGDYRCICRATWPIAAADALRRIRDLHLTRNSATSKTMTISCLLCQPYMLISCGTQKGRRL